MEVVKAFITLKAGNKPDKMLELDIMNFIRKKLSPLAMPQKLNLSIVCPNQKRQNNEA
jgi:acyl-coenzyme A synthetase/AMP-(fatty) acid ligase